MVKLVLVPAPRELPPIAAEPVAPDDAPIALPEPVALAEPMAPDDDPVDEELSVVPEPDDTGAEDMLDGAGAMAGVDMLVSSTFLPHAPRANSAARAMLVVMAGFIFNANIQISLRTWEGDGLARAIHISQISI